MAGDAIVFLKELLPATGLVAHRLTVRDGGAAGVDGGRVKNEGYAQRAEYESIVDAAFPPKNGPGRPVYRRSRETKFCIFSERQ